MRTFQLVCHFRLAFLGGLPHSGSVAVLAVRLPFSVPPISRRGLCVGLGCWAVLTRVRRLPLAWAHTSPHLHTQWRFPTHSTFASMNRPVRETAGNRGLSRCSGDLGPQAPVITVCPEAPSSRGPGRLVWPTIILLVRPGLLFLPG